MITLQLFLSFLQIGMFSFGGGYAALPLIQEQVVTQHGWLSRSEFTDLITISQMTPGPIAVNSATFVGIRLAGFLGALAATFGCILPSCILVTVLSYLYLKYRKMSIFCQAANRIAVELVRHGYCQINHYHHKYNCQRRTPLIQCILALVCVKRQRL